MKKFFRVNHHMLHRNTGPAPEIKNPVPEVGEKALAIKNPVTETKEDHLALLKHFDVVLLIDDSASMTGRNWKEAERALIELAKVAAKYDDDGLEIYFLNSSSTITTNDVEKIRNLFESVKPWGRTPLGKTLNWLLKTYMERLKTSEVKIKPVNYIVITDGEADDPHITESTIIDTARELDALNKSPSQIGIQFVQIGNDENATQFLKRLDDKLANAENGFIRARTSFSFYAAGPN